MKLLITAKTALIIGATIMTSLSAAAPAQAGLFSASEIREWNVCDWERIPENVMQRITRRGDFEDILRRMFDSCPDSALAFTDRPTASVEISDNGRSGTPDSGNSGPTRESEPEEGPADEPSDEQEFGLPG